MATGASPCDRHHLWRGRKPYRPLVGATAVCRVAQTRGRRSAGCGGIERGCDRSDEIRFTKRLADDHGARPEGLNRSGVPTDEEMRDWSRAEDFLNSRNTATSRQSRVNDDQVRPVSGGRRYRVGLSGCCGADIVPHSCEQFRKQGRDQGVVLDDEDPKRSHRSRCARSRPDRNQYLAEDRRAGIDLERFQVKRRSRCSPRIIGSLGAPHKLVEIFLVRG
jgi:hypothetical protein